MYQNQKGKLELECATGYAAYRRVSYSDAAKFKELNWHEGILQFIKGPPRECIENILFKYTQ